MPKPVLVVTGLPRSGTSLVMQLLEAAGVPLLVDAEREADESNPRGYYELSAVKGTRSDPSWLGQAEGRAVKVVCPLLFDLPADARYRVVLATRDAEEVLASQRAMLDRLGRGDVDPSDDGMAPAFDALVERTRTWLAGADCVEDWIELRHGELMQDPEAAAARLAAFLDAGADLARIAARIEPALYRARRRETSPATCWPGRS